MTPDGQISGGWEFVIAAYVISAIVYVLYTYSVLRRDAASRALAGPGKEKQS
jgi:hypothetical protein